MSCIIFNSCMPLSSGGGVTSLTGLDREVVQRLPCLPSLLCSSVGLLEFTAWSHCASSEGKTWLEMMSEVSPLRGSLVSRGGVTDFHHKVSRRPQTLRLADSSTI